MTTSFHAHNAQPLDDRAIHNANLMREACLRTAASNGTRVVWTDGQGLPPGAFGLFTADPTPAGREILVRSGMDPVNEAVVLAHEAGHRCDPWLNTYDMAHYYENNVDTCEAVAHYAAYLVAKEYHLLNYLPNGWFSDVINSHYPLDDLLSDSNMVHRADVGAMQMLYPEAVERLKDQRLHEGREGSGLTGWKKLWNKANSKQSGSARCGEWMPVAETFCQKPRHHSGHCQSSA